MIATAIVIAGVLVSASLFVAIGGTTKTVTLTSSAPPTTITVATTNSNAMHLLTFHQNYPCTYASLAYSYLLPWSVTLNGSTTVTAPPNANILNCCTTTTNGTYSTIVFSIPSGTYSYRISPLNGLTPQVGTAVVAGQDVIIQVYAHLASCGTLTSTQ